MTHPYKASATSPLCVECGERKQNRYGTHGLPGSEQGEKQAETAGDQATKESGTCQDCKGRIIREGRQREANRANLRAHLAANS